MKTIALFLSLFISIMGFAQAKLGMSSAYSITPTSATSSSIGASYGQTITVSCYVRNKGNAVFNGGIDVKRKVTSPGYQSTDSTTQVIVSTINPGDSVFVSFTDTINPIRYKQSGNGNTVVVWPISTGITTTDSLFTIPVYVNTPSSVGELAKNKLLVYPSPAGDVLYIKPETGVEYNSISIYDIQMKEVMKLPFKETIDLKALAPGLYHIYVSTNRQADYTTLFIKAD